eukprot:SAG31_NODE_9733_length_1235_cov_1.808099_1_plen_72_part_00
MQELLCGRAHLCLDQWRQPWWGQSVGGRGRGAWGSGAAGAAGAAGVAVGLAVRALRSPEGGLARARVSVER